MLQANKPRLVADLDFVAVAAGQEWNKQNHQLGGGDASTKTSVAETLAGVPKIVSVYAAASYSAAISSSGHLYCWGSNDVGQLGLETPLHLRDISSEADEASHPIAAAADAASTQRSAQQDTTRTTHVRTFDSNHNVLLPQRVQAVDAIRVAKLAVGPNHMFCFGTERPDDDSAIVGRTLNEVQEEQRAKRSVPDIIGDDKANEILAAAYQQQQQHDREPVSSPVVDDTVLKTLDDAASFSRNNNTNNAVCSSPGDDGMPQVDASAGASPIDNAYIEDFLSASSTTLEASLVSLDVVPDHEIAASLQTTMTL